MGMESVRIAFGAAAAGALRLEHAGLAYQGGQQVLSLTGWHADGTPFALVTAPFAGDVQARARRAARDIIAAHGSAPTPSLSPTPIDSLRSTANMSQKGSGLARLMGGLRNLDASADALATRLETAMASLQGEMATTAQIVGNVESSVNDLRTVNALYSNGGPPLPTSGGSSAGSGGSPS
ncbi:MAG TPA: hypothetical protein VKX28_29270 [Xanthobacteraceae bacterium]|nr:hypothetical protein [Xanthobacteraceae bacterium]